MRVLILLCFSILGSIDVLCQQQSLAQIISEAKDKKISFANNPFPQIEKFNANEIKVFDCRFDSSKIGYIRNGINDNYTYHKLILEENWNSIYAKYFAHNLDSSSSNKLLIFIRDCWVNESLFNEKIVNKKYEELEKFLADYLYIATVGSDIFLETPQGIVPLVKIQADIPLKNIKKKDKSTSYFTPLLDTIGKAILTAQPNPLIKDRKKILSQDLFIFYMNRFEKTILKNPSLIRGVFLTFEDFLNNNVAISDFKIQRGRVTDELYQGKNGDGGLIDKYFAYTDGQYIYFKIGFNSFKGLRQQNTFEVLGTGQVTESYYDWSYRSLKLTSVSKDLEKYTLQLNMQTGKFY